MSRLRIAFFASGNGTLFEHLATRMQDGVLHAVPALLISSSSKAPALARAQRLQIPSVVIRREDYPTEAEFALALQAVLV